MPTFVDSETGEVLVEVEEDDYESPRRAYRRAQEEVPEQRSRVRQSLWPVALVFACILSFLIGGGVATGIQQQEVRVLKMELGYPDVP